MMFIVSTDLAVTMGSRNSGTVGIPEADDLQEKLLNRDSCLVGSNGARPLDRDRVHELDLLRHRWSR